MTTSPEPQFLPDADRAARAGAFASVAGEYERGRPGYPSEAIRWLLGGEPLEVLDLGAGTGKLTDALLRAGHRVTAVEPLREMRAILSELHPRARVLAGAAERLPLREASVDAVLVGAAFHWFEERAALREIERVLRAPGVLGLLGNAFDTSKSWVASLREMLGPPAIQTPGHWPSQEVLREHFAEVADARFPHAQRVTRDTLRDLALSRSSVAILERQEREALLARIDVLWQGNEELAGAGDATLGWIAHVRRCRALRGDACSEPTRRGERAAECWEPVRVDAEAVRPLRGEVLRPGQGPEQLIFDADEAPETLHVAVTVAGAVVGIASLMREACPRAPAPGAWRLRGMATSTPMRGRGIGAALLARCEAHAREQCGRLLWCNARVGARAFYERAGMTVVGEPFDIPAIGEHHLMCKEIHAPGARAGTC